MAVSRKQKEEEALYRLMLMVKTLGMKRNAVTKYIADRKVMLSSPDGLTEVNAVPGLAEEISFVEAKLNVLVYHAVKAPTIRSGYSLLYVSNEVGRWKNDREKLNPYTDPFGLSRIFVDTITVILHKNTPFIPKVVSLVAHKGVLRVLG